MKNKSHMLVLKNPSQHCPWFQNISRNNFQLNLICFHMVAKKDFATVLDACWRSVVLFHKQRGYISHALEKFGHTKS